MFAKVSGQVPDSEPAIGLRGIEMGLAVARARRRVSIPPCRHQSEEQLPIVIGAVLEEEERVRRRTGELGANRRLERLLRFFVPMAGQKRGAPIGVGNPLSSV